MTTKISIRFFNDHEMRAVWDEENAKWWFSATDKVRAMNWCNRISNLWRTISSLSIDRVHNKIARQALSM